MRDAPYAGLYLMLYEKGKTILEEGVGVGKEEGEEWKGRVASGEYGALLDQKRLTTS